MPTLDSIVTSAGSAVVNRQEGLCGESVLISWTSNSSGAVTLSGLFLEGLIAKVVFGVGSATPTTAYDVVLNDADSIDVLGGDGANITVTGSVVKVPVLDSLPAYTFGQHTLSITNAGDAKSGTLRIYMYRG